MSLAICALLKAQEFHTNRGYDEEEKRKALLREQYSHVILAAASRGVFTCTLRIRDVFYLSDVRILRDLTEKDMLYLMGWLSLEGFNVKSNDAMSKVWYKANGLTAATTDGEEECALVVDWSYPTK